jgi:GT2 family glycosyltransferase
MQSVVSFSAPAGLPRQRNAILDRAGEAGIIVFFDDDFIPAPGYLNAMAAVFRANPGVIAATGSLIADGSRTAGYTVAEAEDMIAADPTPETAAWKPVPHGYGCNMAFRIGAARRHGLRFDERLPLYAWSEDVDFSHRIARYGAIAEVAGARGVHLGVKHGRTSGYRLGYSQVANPVYLYGKGSYTLGRAARSVGRNIAMNLARAAWPEAYVDRLGRLRGNALATLDMMRGRLAPERILDL